MAFVVDVLLHYNRLLQAVHARKDNNLEVDSLNIVRAVADSSLKEDNPLPDKNYGLLKVEHDGCFRMIGFLPCCVVDRDWIQKPLMISLLEQFPGGREISGRQRFLIFGGGTS